MAGTWRQSRSRRLIAPRTSWLRLVNSLNLQFCRASAKSKHFLTDDGNVCCLTEHAVEIWLKRSRLEADISSGRLTATAGGGSGAEVVPPRKRAHTFTAGVPVAGVAALQVLAARAIAS